MSSLVQDHSFWQNGIEQPSLSRSLAKGKDAQLSLECPGLFSVIQVVWNPVQGTLPGISVNPWEVQGPTLSGQVSSHSPGRFLQSISTHTSQRAPSQASLGPWESESFFHTCGFLYRHSHTGPADAQVWVGDGGSCFATWKD